MWRSIKCKWRSCGVASSAGSVGGVGIIPNLSLATLPDLHLHLMLRCMILTCIWCCATLSSLALDAALHEIRCWRTCADQDHANIKLFDSRKLQKCRCFYFFAPDLAKKSCPIRRWWSCILVVVAHKDNHQVTLKTFKNTVKTHRKHKEDCWWWNTWHRCSDMLCSNLAKIPGKPLRETHHVVVMFITRHWGSPAPPRQLATPELPQGPQPAVVLPGAASLFVRLIVSSE